MNSNALISTDAQEALAANAHLEEALPAEVWGLIFKFLAPHDLAAAAKTCRFFNIHAREVQLRDTRQLKEARLGVYSERDLAQLNTEHFMSDINIHARTLLNNISAIEHKSAGNDLLQRLMPKIVLANHITTLLELMAKFNENKNFKSTLFMLVRCINKTPPSLLTQLGFTYFSKTQTIEQRVAIQNSTCVRYQLALNKIYTQINSANDASSALIIEQKFDQLIPERIASLKKTLEIAAEYIQAGQTRLSDYKDATSEKSRKTYIYLKNKFSDTLKFICCLQECLIALENKFSCTTAKQLSKKKGVGGM